MPTTPVRYRNRTKAVLPIVFRKGHIADLLIIRTIRPPKKARPS